MAEENRLSNFVHGLAQEVFVSWWQRQSFFKMDVVKITWRLNFLAN